jgi:hypothetical protein
MSYFVPPAQIEEAPSLLNPLEQQYFDCFLNTLILDPQNVGSSSTLAVSLHPTPSAAFEMPNIHPTESRALLNSPTQSEKNDHGKPKPGRIPRLSQDQKRLNHLESEKRRRQCVKEAFDRLIDTSPFFKGASYGSKSNLLDRVAQYIHSLHNDIHILTHHLHSLNHQCFSKQLSDKETQS